MNKLIFFLLGAAAGTGVTYFVMRTHVKKATDELAERDAEDADAFRKRLEREVGGVGEEDIEETTEEELIDHYFNCLKDLGVELRYQEVEDSDIHEKEEVNPVNDEEEDGPEDDGVSVYPIQKVMYDATKNDYSKERLAYYAGDKVFVDLETNEPVDGPKQYVGEEINFDAMKNKSVVYIRNEALESDFEVVVYKTSFAAATGESDNEDDYNPGDMAD